MSVGQEKVTDAHAVKADTTIDSAGCQVSMVDDYIDSESDDTGLFAGSSMTDEANAIRFVQQHGSTVRYVKKWHAWMVWDGMRWAEEETDLTLAKARLTARSIYAEALAAKSDALAEKLAKWARDSKSADRMEKMVRVASWDPRVTATPKEFDRDAWALNTPGGIINLRTGDTKPHDQAAMHTKITQFEVSHETPTQWLAFLDETFKGDAELIDWVQKLLGYSLLGTVREHLLVICWGNGANGKSTLLETVQAVLGEYAAPADPSLLMSKRADAHPAGIADLRGLRLVTCQETDQGRTLDEATVKNLTGGTTRKARLMRGNFFSYVPSDTIWLATNHLPTIKNNDAGIWRRVKLIPFTNECPPDRQDPDLKDKLVYGEGAQILGWLVDGCLRYQREKLGTAEAVVKATAMYQSDMDLIGAFINERCVLDPNKPEMASVLFQEYTYWCNDNKYRAMNTRDFSRELKNRGFQEIRVSAGKCYSGLRIRDIVAEETEYILSDRSSSDDADSSDDDIELPEPRQRKAAA